MAAFVRTLDRRVLLITNDHLRYNVNDPDNRAKDVQQFQILCNRQNNVIPLFTKEHSYNKGPVDLVDKRDPWKFGFDLMAQEVPAFINLTPENVFEIANRVPQIGDRVGMVVVRSFAIKGDGTTSGCNLLKLFGRPNQLCCYTGTVLKVGSGSFIHDINTCEGCSGALLFYLGGEDQLKVFGIHAGQTQSTVSSSNSLIVTTATTGVLGPYLVSFAALDYFGRSGDQRFDRI